MTSATARGTTRGVRPTTSVAELSAAVEVVASFVQGFDPGVYSGEDAAHLVTVFTRAERFGGAGKTLAANRAASCNRHVLTGHRSAAEWLATQTGESVGDALSVLALGGDLVDQPGVDEALREGKLSPTWARLVSTAVRENPAREGDLLEGARHDNLRQLKERCLRARRRAAPPTTRRRPRPASTPAGTVAPGPTRRGPSGSRPASPPMPGPRCWPRSGPGATASSRRRGGRDSSSPRRLPGRRPGGPGDRGGDPRGHHHGGHQGRWRGELHPRLHHEAPHP
jgi:hypothetical protein